LIRFPKYKMNYTVSGEAVANLNKDIKEAKKCFRNNAFKATMVLCGSVLELALLDRLSIDTSIARRTYTQLMNKRAPRIERWSLDEMLQVSRRLNFLSRETYQLCHLLRGYRNLIHPAVSRRASIIPNQSRAQRSLEAIRQALGDLDSGFASVWQNLYIINIRNIPASFISNKVNLQTCITNFAQQHGLTVNQISSYSRMKSMLQNPPKQVIVVNTHGEIMPVPRGRNWRNFYKLLGKTVKDYGWIFINIGGYPLYYERPGHDVKGDGLNAFLSVNNVTADCMNPARVGFTGEGTKLVHLANMQGLPHQLFASRCARWQDVSQKIVFLRNGLFCGASAVRIGRGWFVHVGLDSSFGNPNATPAQLAAGDTILGNLGIASALYIADKL